MTRPHTSASPRSRDELLDSLERSPHADVLIIGGGINGLGLLRELALQGVSATLIERDDFVSGASAASSHMVHGGIRYLENGEFRLVRESVEERNALLTLAPHCVTPLPTTVPVYSTFSGLLSAGLRFLTGRAGRHAERGGLVIKVGLTLYDAYSRGGGSLPGHSFAGRRRSLAELPDIDPTVKYTATYFDARMSSPERLALEVLHDAEDAAAGARAINYVEAVDLTADGIVARDLETGRTFTLDADIVVNATGPWTDLTNAAIGEGTAYMGGTKGSHIVLDHPELLAATGGREIFFEHDDGRIVLIHPIGDRVLVGTTDLPHDMTLPALCTEEEVDYFFDLIRSVFPAIPVERAQIVFRFAGVRPLPAHDGSAVGRVSRDYSLRERRDAGRVGRTVLSLVGGKWTTFRALAHSLGADVLGRLGRGPGRDTSAVPIGGGREYPVTPDARSAWRDRHGSGIPRERLDTLLERYGSRAALLAAVIRADGDRMLEQVPGHSVAEIRWLVRGEHVVHLTDLVLRRTSLAFEGRAGDRALEELARIAAVELGWSDHRADEEIARTRAVLHEFHGVDVDAAVG